MQTQYETEKKDNEITKLNAEQKLKQLKIEQLHTERKLAQLAIEKQQAEIAGNKLLAKQKEDEIMLLSKERELLDRKRKNAGHQGQYCHRPSRRSGINLIEHKNTFGSGA